MALVDYEVICNSQEEDFGCNPDCIDRELLGPGLRYPPVSDPGLRRRRWRFEQATQPNPFMTSEAERHPGTFVSYPR
jgi:hypothetical protein